MRNTFDATRLAKMVKAKRGNTPLRATSTAICAQCGDVSPSTLSRVENAQGADVDTLLTLADWLEVPVATFFETEEGAEPDAWTSERLAQVVVQCADLEPHVATALAIVVRASKQRLP